MNPEQNNLMFLMALPTVFSDYHVDSTGFTILESGKVFCHMSHCGTMGIKAMKDLRVVGYGQEDLLAYIEYVDPRKGNLTE